MRRRTIGPRRELRRGLGRGLGRGSHRGPRRRLRRGLVFIGVVSAAAVVAVVSAGGAGGAGVAGPEPPAERSLEPAPTPLGKAAAIKDDGDWVWVEAGFRLLREPDFESGHLAYVEVRTQLEVLERHQHWVRVRHGALIGWISTVPQSTGDSTGESTADGPPANGTAVSARYVARARDVFELEDSPESFGEFALYTDVTDDRILEILRKTSRHLPSAYKERYGLEGQPPVRETILLFAREADYRAFTLEDVARRRPDLRGHATPEIAVLYVGDHSSEAVVAVLVHELTHLLNRRVFGAPIPPWLEEGLANDLAFCRIDARGRPRLGSLGGRSVVIEQPEYDQGGFIRIDRRVHLTGPMASLRSVQERWRTSEALPLALLTDLVWSEFTDSRDRGLRYATSAFLVRYLLDSGGDSGAGRLASGFRSFLRSVAAGGAAGPEDLARYLNQGLNQELKQGLDRGLDEGLLDLDTGFASWIAAQRLSGS